ncbi:hypothetical protein K431DRAFT_226022, partial [Polychaeton citri CBS 116435]
LHAKLLMSRNIAVTEQINLHPVWTKGKISVKPLPRYLFNEEYFPGYTNGAHDITRCARGFPYSYVTLIASEKDFRVGHGAKLLPAVIYWPSWCTFVRQLIGRGARQRVNIYDDIDERYPYGELRPSQLDEIYCWTRGNFLHRYSRETAVSFYGEFFRNHCGKLAGVVVYISIVLIAMQVGLADGVIEGSQEFENACYGFAVCSIIGPLVASALIVAIFLFLSSSHWVRTRCSQVRRCRDMGIDQSKLGIVKEASVI